MTIEKLIFITKDRIVEQESLVRNLEGDLRDHSKTWLNYFRSVLAKLKELERKNKRDQKLENKGRIFFPDLEPNFENQSNNRKIMIEALNYWMKFNVQGPDYDNAVCQRDILIKIEEDYINEK